AELVGLCGLAHLLLIHAFVNHAGDLYITAKRYPAQAPFGFPYLLFEQGEPGVKKKIKFLYTALKPFGREEMAELVQNNYDGKGQDELRRFNACICPVDS